MLASRSMVTDGSKQMTMNQRVKRYESLIRRARAAAERSRETGRLADDVAQQARHDTARTRALLASLRLARGR